MKRIGTTLLAIVVGLALIGSAGTMHSRLLDARDRYELDHAEPLENAPPLVVFSTVALGGFSGIIADILWVRAAQLQMEGQYFELVQLADWITKLQPRFPEGWVYHSWNLSYNVSVMFQRPEDRWRWVRHGIELLRDGGLRYNPANPTLHRELAWLFHHKIGESLDQAHLFYKLSWALEMERLFDGRAPDYEALARTPTSRHAVMQAEGVPALVDELREAGFDPFSYQWPDARRIPAMGTILRDHPAGETLFNHIRLRMLVDRYRLVPARMKQIEDEYGPLDWRMPQAHTIYWAWNGLMHADGFEQQMMERMIFHSLTEAFRQGRFVFNPEEEIFIPDAHPDMLPYVMRAFEEAVRKFDDERIRSAHLHFLNHALTVMYTHDRMQDAQMLLDEIRSRYPSEAAELELDQYVLLLMAAGLEDLSIEDAAAMMEEWFYDGFYWLALNEAERAAGYKALARNAWRHYRETRTEVPTELPSIDALRSNALNRARADLSSASARDRLPAPVE